MHVRAVGRVVGGDVEALAGLRVAQRCRRPAATQFCAPVPLQVQSWILVPSAVPPPETSRHLPSALQRAARRHRPGLRGGAVAGVELDLRAVGGAAPLSTSRHLPPSPTIGPVAGPAAGGEGERVHVEQAPAPPAKTRYSEVVDAGPRASDGAGDVDEGLPAAGDRHGDRAEQRCRSAEPARTSSVPPAPAEETRAVNEVALSSRYGLERDPVAVVDVADGLAALGRRLGRRPAMPD